jgi:hypothetical protein
MLEIKKSGNSDNRKLFRYYMLEFLCIMTLYIGTMVFALCWFSQPFDEQLELITVTGYTETETTTTTTTTTIETTTTTTTTEETTTTTTKTTTTTTETTTSITETTTTTTAVVTEKQDDSIDVSKNDLNCLGTFKGTYYSGNSVPCKGGSGRTLINCNTSGNIKGSVACRAVFNSYGYNRNGRTKVWIECSGMPSMTGWYYVDDCCGSGSVVDFYYYKNSNCPFRNSGVISVKVYI